MSELSVRHLEVLQPAPAIAGVLDQWLREEVQNSNTGRNNFLDDLSLFREGITLPYGESATSRKSVDHLHRLENNFSEGFATSPEDDQAIARQIFGMQMRLSGLFRFECYLQASDQADYEQRRFGGSASNIDLSHAVSDRLIERVGHLPDSSELSQHTISLDELMTSTSGAIETDRQYQQIIYGHSPEEVSKGKNDITELLEALQYQWAQLIVDYVVFAAQERGGQLSKVPMLEPKSITDAKIYYPFATSSK